LKIWALVFLGGGCGSLARWFVISKLNAPLGTLFVNLLGSFLVGYLAQKFSTEYPWFPFLIVGVLGGFTTFSAFSWDVLRLSGTSFEWKALAYIFFSVGGAAALCLLGRNLAFKF
jgi:CrcB protein